ncbi:hypothetical protein SprV_0501809800 [Sparganum proliferum]
MYPPSRAIMREMQGAWGACKTQDIDRNQSKNAFGAVKAIYGPLTKGIAPFLSPDGSKRLMENSQIMKRWTERFRNVLDRSSEILDATIDWFLQLETNTALDRRPSFQKPFTPCNNYPAGE